MKAAHSDDTCSVFYDSEVAQLIRMIIKKGERLKARTIVEDCFQIIKELQLKKYWKEENLEEREHIIISPAILYNKAVKNCTPVMETMYIKRGGQYYHVPVSVKPNRASFLARKFIITAANEKTDHTTNFHFENSLAIVIISAANNEGPAVQKKLNLHKLCDANRAYAHYRWG